MILPFPLCSLLRTRDESLTENDVSPLYGADVSAPEAHPYNDYRTTSRATNILRLSRSIGSNVTLDL